MSEKDQYITQEEARQKLGVTRSTLYYYMKTLNVEKKKFLLDRHVYLLKADFERILKAKGILQEEESSSNGSLPEAA